MQLVTKRFDILVSYDYFQVYEYSSIGFGWSSTNEPVESS